MRRGFVAVGIYGVLTVALLWPVLAHFGSVFPHDAGDPVLNAWILWHDSQFTPLTHAWWNGPMFFPMADSLALSELLLSLVPISWLAQAITHNPVAAYNAVFALSFPLCGLAAYALARDIAGREDAALVGGLAFLFAPYRAEQLSHIQVLALLLDTARAPRSPPVREGPSLEMARAVWRRLAGAGARERLCDVSRLGAGRALDCVVHASAPVGRARHRRVGRRGGADAADPPEVQRGARRAAPDPRHQRGEAVRRRRRRFPVGGARPRALGRTTGSRPSRDSGISRPHHDSHRACCAPGRTGGAQGATRAAGPMATRLYSHLGGSRPGRVQRLPDWSVGVRPAHGARLPQAVFHSGGGTSGGVSRRALDAADVAPAFGCRVLPAGRGSDVRARPRSRAAPPGAADAVPNRRMRG